MFNKRGRIVFSVLAAVLVLTVLTPAFGAQESERPPSPVPEISMPQLLRLMGIPAAKLGIYIVTGQDNNYAICLLDAKNLVTYGPYLKNQFGSSETVSLLDVVLDKKGKIAIVSSETTTDPGRVYFISVAKVANPAILSSVNTTFPSVDVALTPNGKFALVAGCPYVNKIASINVKTRTLVQELTLPSGYYTNAVAVAKDNQTVVTADSVGKAIDYFLLDPKTGVLTRKGRRTAVAANPMKIVISPDGKTVFALSQSVDQATSGFGNLYQITAPGAVTDRTQRVPAPSADLYRGHGAVFSKDGKKLYVLGSLEADGDGFYQHVIYVFNVTAPGTVVDSGISIKIYNFFNQSQNSNPGADSMALTPEGNFIFISNHQLYGKEKNRIAVVDLTRNAHVYSLIVSDEGTYPYHKPAAISFKAF